MDMKIFGKAVVYGIIYLLGSVILGAIICCFTGDSINGADLDTFPLCAWIAGCIVCIWMVLWCIYH